jgi:hypothetical protein
LLLDAEVFISEEQAMVMSEVDAGSKLPIWRNGGHCVGDVISD